MGSSESVPEDSELFQTLDKKHRFYVRRTVPRVGVPVPIGTGTLQRALHAKQTPVLPGPVFGRPVAAALPPASDLSPSEERAALTDLHFQLIERHAPPSVVVNEHHDIVHLSENASRFMQAIGGQPTTNLLRSIHPTLRAELRGALFRAVETHAPVEIFGVPMAMEGVPRMVDLRVAPAAELAPGYLLVSFTARDPDPAAANGSASPRPDAEAVVRHLEQEVEHVRDQLRDTVERYEASAEEYKSSHEELQSMNEELRSASEELETSREELQSINEELTTVNSELKSNLEELGRSNSDLQNLMNATSVVTVFLDRELKVTRFTPNAAELFFLIPTDVGRPLEHVKLRLDYPDLIADAQKVLRTLVPIEREVDGTDDRRWFLVRLQPYRTTEDRIGGVVVTFVDITDRKTADAQRRRTEERLRLIVNSARDYAIFALDLERRVTSWSPGAQAMLGYAEADILGQPGDLVFTPEDRAANAPVLETEKAKREGRAENERYHLRQDGTRFYGSGLSMPLREDDGTLIGFVKIMRDLTEAKYAEDALRVSEEQFRSFVEATSDAVYKMSPDWSEMRYLEGKQFLADTQDPSCTWLEAYIPPEDQPPVLAAIQEAIHAKRPFELEHRIIRSDGALGWTFSRAIPLLDARGEITEWIGAASDVTERKRAEEAIRTAFLEVEQARGEAVAANQAKDHFLAVLSHELRTPLMPITMALAGLKRRQDVSEPVRKAHEMIGRNVDLEARFIDDMLDVTRIARGKMELVRKDMDLHEAVRRAVEVATPDIEAKGQRLTVTLEAGECRLHGDMARLQQGFWNLLKNASKFTPKGGAIEIRSWCPDDDHHLVQVIDTGIGLEAEAVERIFNAFEQASASITREFGGLGLGLAIARATVDAHGGTLHASSPGPGQGATFTVNLPLTAVPTAATGTSV